ncbi:MAG: hypothetical protein GC136_10030 [Alphaproteobacteria bacterium]|nr:hypothetical protein [Alphaproteobacteria bacterium]
MDEEEEYQQQGAKPTAAHVLKEIVLSPPVLYGVGNIPVLLHTASWEGQALNASVLVGSILTRGFEAATNRELGMPYGVRAISNAGIASSVFMKGVSEVGLENFVTDDASRLALLTGVAFVCYSASNAFQAYKVASTKSKNAVSNVAQGFQSAGAAVWMDLQLIPTTLLVAAFGQAVRNKKYDETIEVTDAGSFVRKHATPSAINAVAFYASAAADAFVNPYVAFAKGVWGTASLLWEPDKTKQMGKDALALLTKKPA